MEAFDICARGLDTAVKRLVHHSAVTPAKFIDLLRQLAKFHIPYDCRILVTSLAERYNDHITAHFTHLRRYARKIDAQLSPCVSLITHKLRLTIDQLSDSTSQRVRRYIIPDHEKGRTGSWYNGKHGIYMFGKHSALGKAIKALTEKATGDKSSSKEEVRRKRKKTRRASISINASKQLSLSSGVARAPCFLCGAHGNLSSEFTIPREKWVTIESAELQNSTGAVRDIIMK